MKLQVKGLLKSVKKQTGTSISGKDWTRYEVIVISGDQELPISFFGDSHSNLTNHEAGDNVTFDATLGSREYAGKFYLQLNGVKDLTEKKPKKVVKDDLPF
jgi:hypothetical protein